VADQVSAPCGSKLPNRWGLFDVVGDPIVQTGLLAAIGGVVTRVLLRGHPTRSLVGQLAFDARRSAQDNITAFYKYGLRGQLFSGGDPAEQKEEYRDAPQCSERITRAHRSICEHLDGLMLPNAGAQPRGAVRRVGWSGLSSAALHSLPNAAS
jgi:hypothetical protein